MNAGTIQDFLSRCKAVAEEGIGEWGLLAVIFLVGLGSFGLGRLSALEDARPPVSIQEAPSAARPAALSVGGLLVASKSGSVYYYPWCSGAAKITVANQAWFASEAAAQKAGYKPSKSCKGLADQ